MPELTSCAPLPAAPDFLDFHTFTERLAMAGDSQAPCALALLRLDILNWPQDHDQPLNLGEIIAQAAIPILPGDTADSLAARLLPEEHKLYPRALAIACARLRG